MDICQLKLLLGFYVKFLATCNSGHTVSIESSRTIGSGQKKVPYVNILMIVLTFLCGLHFDKIKVTYYYVVPFLIWEMFQSFFIMAGIQSISSSTYYRYLKKIVYPVTWTFWLMHQAQNISSMIVSTSMVLSVDSVVVSIVTACWKYVMCHVSKNVI